MTDIQYPNDLRMIIQYVIQTERPYIPTTHDFS